MFSVSVKSNEIVIHATMHTNTHTKLKPVFSAATYRLCNHQPAQGGGRGDILLTGEKQKKE